MEPRHIQTRMTVRTSELIPFGAGIVPYTFTPYPANLRTGPWPSGIALCPHDTVSSQESTARSGSQYQTPFNMFLTLHVFFFVFLFSFACFFFFFARFSLSSFFACP